MTGIKQATVSLVILMGILFTSCNPLRKIGSEPEAIFSHAQVKRQVIYGSEGSEEVEIIPENLLTISEYNQRGQESRYSRLSPVTSDTFVTEHRYNAKGQLTQSLYYFEGEATPVNYEYDEDGILRRAYEAGAEARIYSYHYNDKGWLIFELGKAAYPNDEGEVQWAPQDSTVYDYTPQGKMSRKRFYMWDEIYNDTRFYHDKRGLLIKEEEYRDDGTVARRKEYTYNRKGLPVSYRIEQPDDEAVEYQRAVYEFMKNST